MKKTRRIALTSLLVVAVGALVWPVLLAGTREPVCRGKTLSQWAIQLGESRDYVSQFYAIEAGEAINKIGTNSIPILLEWIEAKDGSIEERLLEWTQRFPGYHIRLESDRNKRWYAMLCFQALGPIAKPAVPGLIRLVRSPRLEVRAAAVNALGSIGPDAKEAVPVLLESIQGRFPAEAEGRWALAQIDPATARDLEAALKK